MFSTTYDAKNKVWRGPNNPPTYNPEQNLGNLLLTCLEFRSSGIAQIVAETGVALTCKQLRERSIIMAEYIKKFNFSHDEFIGFVTYNTENLVPTAFGCYVMGIPISPLSPMLASDDIGKVYGILKPRLIFCDKRNLSIVQEAVDKINLNTKIITVMEKVKGYDCVTEILRHADYSAVETFIAPNVDPDQLLAVVCSSGTTGIPKRIAKTHRDLILGFGIGWKAKLSRTSVYLTYSPLFWITGLNSMIFSTLNHAVNVITTEMFHQTEEFIDILQRYKVTSLTTLPLMITHILGTKNLKPFEYVDSWMISGFASTKTLCEKFEPYLPNGNIQISYGLTEIGYISVNKTKDYDHIGYLSNGMEIKLVDTNGNRVGPNELGEILIKNNNKFCGYHGDPKKTAEALDDGWFISGDIAYFDDQNRLHYVDRKVDIMNYEGHYIVPHELEAIVGEVDGVVNNAIVGILDKESMNHILYAFVVPDKSKNLTKDQVIDHVHSKVVHQSKLHGGVHFVDVFPLGRTGKVDKIKLREIAMKLAS